MTISSRFYTGFVNNIDWAEGTRRLGYQYTVAGYDDFRVEIDETGTRRVKVLGVGAIATGGGIEDIADADELVTLDDAPVGSSRWHLVGLDRVWGATNATALDSILGTATKQLPTRPDEPGVEDFQPLALVQITYGETLPTAIVDLRVVADNSGMLIAFDNLARSYLTEPGTVIKIGDALWISGIDDGGNQAWTRQWLATVPDGAAAYDTGWLPMEKTTGWEDVPGSPAQYSRVGKTTSIRGRVRRISGTDLTDAASPCYIPDNNSKARPTARYDTSGRTTNGDYRMWIDTNGLVSTGVFPEPTDTIYVAMTFNV